MRELWQRGVAPPAARRVEDIEEDELFLFLLLLSPSLFGVYDMRKEEPKEQEETRFEQTARKIVICIDRLRDKARERGRSRGSAREREDSERWRDPQNTV